MGVHGGSSSEAFAAFWRANEVRLRRALVAHYGPVDGAVAAGDALSWAWEHWGDVEAMVNPVGYLYRVGQTAARRQRAGPIPAPAGASHGQDPADGDLDLIDALRALSDQQRVAVLLVYAHGYSLRDAAEVLDVAVSTVRVHLDRAVRHLRLALDITEADAGQALRTAEATIAAAQQLLDSGRLDPFA